MMSDRALLPTGYRLSTVVLPRRTNLENPIPVIHPMGALATTRLVGRSDLPAPRVLPVYRVFPDRQVHSEPRGLRVRAGYREWLVQPGSLVHLESPGLSDLSDLSELQVRLVPRDRLDLQALSGH